MCEHPPRGLVIDDTSPSIVSPDLGTAPHLFLLDELLLARD
jgi:hypothetical protein